MGKLKNRSSTVPDRADAPAVQHLRRHVLGRAARGIGAVRRGQFLRKAEVHYLDVARRVDQNVLLGG